MKFLILSLMMVSSFSFAQDPKATVVSKLQTQAGFSTTYNSCNNGTYNMQQCITYVDSSVQTAATVESTTLGTATTTTTTTSKTFAPLNYSVQQLAQPIQL